MQPGSSNANDVNETIPISNNTVIASTTLSGNDSIVTDNTTTTTTNTDIGAITNTTSGLAIDDDFGFEEGDFFHTNSKKPRLTIDDFSSVDVELYKTNDNISIMKESKDSKKRAKNQPNRQSKRNKVSDKSNSIQSDFNEILPADDIGQEPSGSKTIKAKFKKPSQSVAGLSGKARSIGGTFKSKSNQTLNANDFSSDLCGNSDTGDTNVTMGRGYEGRKSVKRDSEHRLEGGRGRGAQVRRGGTEGVPVLLMCL